MADAGWDLGGAEDPYDAEYTTVDIIAEEEFRDDYQRRFIGDKADWDYRQQDLTILPWGLEPRQRINCSLVLRYLLDKVSAADLARELWDCTRPSGQIRLFDEMPILRPVCAELRRLGGLMPDLPEDFPEDVEYTVTVRKPA
jgi:hypothetical protein